MLQGGLVFQTLDVPESVVEGEDGPLGGSGQSRKKAQANH
jgi:hypothetical protein